MSFEPWKPGPINPFCVLLCVLLLIETSGWEPAKRWREGERKSHHRWRDIELYLLGGTQHGVLFGAVLSRRNRPSDGWGSWLLVPLRMCCAPTTHSHTYRCTQERQQRERRKNWLELVVDAARHKWCPPPSFLFLLAVLFTSRCTLRGYTHRRQIYIYLYTSPLLYINTCIREWKASRETQSTNLNHPRLHSLSFSFSW